MVNFRPLSHVPSSTKRAKTIPKCHSGFIHSLTRSRTGQSSTDPWSLPAAAAGEILTYSCVIFSQIQCIP
jgi:hypothetical protein